MQADQAFATGVEAVGMKPVLRPPRMFVGYSMREGYYIKNEGDERVKGRAGNMDPEELTKWVVRWLVVTVVGTTMVGVLIGVGLARWVG